LFTYDEKYLYAKNAFSLGPELPLTQRKYVAKNLFPAFLDRIPSKQNPAYVEYCHKFGISPDENDVLVLLATIGRKGPSSFVFEKVTESNFGSHDLKAYRENLRLSIREFAAAFDISPATLSKIEKGRTQGQEVLKRVELYVRVPEAARFEVERNLHLLHSDTADRLQSYFTAHAVK
jgi:HipA-like protein